MLHEMICKHKFSKINPTGLILMGFFIDPLRKDIYGIMVKKEGYRGIFETFFLNELESYFLIDSPNSLILGIRLKSFSFDINHFKLKFRNLFNFLNFDFDLILPKV